MREEAAETQTHSEREEETYRGKETVEETDSKIERERNIESPRELKAPGGSGDRDRKTEVQEKGLGRLPCPDWPRLTAIKAYN